MRTPRPFVLALAAVLLILAACDVGPVITPPVEPLPLQTRIVRFDLEPDTVAAGDTVLVRCVVEDSLRADRYTYVWGGGGTTTTSPPHLPVDGRLDGPRIRFVAPRTSTVPGRVNSVVNGVRVDNGDPRARPVFDTFFIPVLN